MVCDGNIAPEEVELVKGLVKGSKLFADFDVDEHLNAFITEVNENGAKFLSRYLNELAGFGLDKDSQMDIVNLAFQTIEADSVIEYSEIKFFKKIRSRLSLTDEEILERYPDKEDFLLPDINVNEGPILDEVSFDNICWH